MVRCMLKADDKPTTVKTEVKVEVKMEVDDDDEDEIPLVSDSTSMCV